MMLSHQIDYVALVHRLDPHNSMSFVPDFDMPDGDLPERFPTRIRVTVLLHEIMVGLGRLSRKREHPKTAVNLRGIVTSLVTTRPFRGCPIS
jgi:hypothetical protein